MGREQFRPRHGHSPCALSGRCREHPDRRAEPRLIIPGAEVGNGPETSDQKAETKVRKVRTPDVRVAWGEGRLPGFPVACCTSASSAGDFPPSAPSLIQSGRRPLPVQVTSGYSGCRDPTRDAAGPDVFEDIVLFCSTQRWHTNNGMLSAVDVEVRQRKPNEAGVRETRGPSARDLEADMSRKPRHDLDRTS